MIWRIAITSVLFACASTAQEHKVSEPDLVARVVAGKSDSKAAARELMARGRLSLREIHRALERTNDREVRGRLESLAVFCAVGGATVEGLRVGLRVSEDPVAVGDAVNVTVTLCNASDTPLEVSVGLDVTRSLLKTGALLSAVDPDDASKRVRMRSDVGVCGTGATQLFERVEPWSAREFTFGATVTTRAPSLGEDPVTVLRTGAPMGFYLTIGDAETVQLCAGFSVPREMRQWMKREKDETLWVGDVESEPALLHVKR